MEIYSVKVKKKITEATIVLCGYVWIHTWSDARKKKKKKKRSEVSFFSKKALWPTQFGKLREIFEQMSFYI